MVIVLATGFVECSWVLANPKVFCFEETETKKNPDTSFAEFGGRYRISLAKFSDRIKLDQDPIL